MSCQKAKRWLPVLASCHTFPTRTRPCLAIAIAKQNGRSNRGKTTFSHTQSTEEARTKPRQRPLRKILPVPTDQPTPRYDTKVILREAYVRALDPKLDRPDRVEREIINGLPVASWSADLTPPTPVPLTASEEAKNAKFMDLLQQDSKTVDTSMLLEYVRDKSNRLQYLTSDITYLLFEELVSRNATRQLRLEDWHRLLQRLFGCTPFDHPSPPNDARRAVITLKEMKRCAVVPDAFVYACLYRAMKDNIRKVDEVHRFVMNTLHQPQIRQDLKIASDKSFRALLAVFLRRAHRPIRLLRARSLWEDMRTAKITPSVETCMGFLEAFRSHNDSVPVDAKGVSEVHNLLASLTKSKKMEQKVYEALMVSHDACGHENAVQKLYQEMQRQMIPAGFTAYKMYLRAIRNGSPTHILRLYSRMRAENIVLDDECYAIISLAYAGLGNRDGLHRMHRRLKESLSANVASSTSSTTNDIRPTPRAYKGLIEAYERLDNWEDVLTAYMELKHLKNTEVAKMDVRADDHIHVVEEKTLISDVWHRESPRKMASFHGPPRSVLRSVVRSIGKAGLIEEARKFFLEEALDRDRLQSYWMRGLAGQEKRLRMQRERAEHALQGAEVGVTHKSKLKNEVGRSIITKLRRELKAVKLAEEKGIQVGVALDGPLRVVYEGFAEGWREMVEKALQPEEHAEKLMEMEEFLGEVFEEEERRLKDVMRRLGVTATVEESTDEDMPKQDGSEILREIGDIERQEDITVASISGTENHVATNVK